MANLEDSIKELTNKVDKLHQPKPIDTFFKIAEKVILPIAVIVLSYQSLRLTESLDIAQNELAKAAQEETKAENLRSEKESQKNLELNYITVIYDDLTSKDSTKIDVAIELIDIFLEAEYSAKFGRLANKLKIKNRQQNQIRTIAIKKSIEQKIEKDQVIESIVTELESDNNKLNLEKRKELESQVESADQETNEELNSRIITFTRNRSVLDSLTNPILHGNRQLYVTQFWDLYWGDMIKYENQRVESAMVKFGLALKSDEPISKLDSLAKNIIEEMNKQIVSDSWVKEGYYRIHKDGFRISLIKLDNKSKQATFKIRSDHQNPIEIQIYEKKQAEFKINGFAYEIIFNRIDKAGKNPFTKAAYYTVKDI